MELFYFESNTKLELRRKLLNIAPKTSSKFKECQFFLVGWQHSATSNNSSLFILFYHIYIVKEDIHHFIKIKMCLNVGLFLQFSKPWVIKKIKECWEIIIIFRYTQLVGNKLQISFPLDCLLVHMLTCAYNGKVVREYRALKLRWPSIPASPMLLNYCSQ